MAFGWRVASFKKQPPTHTHTSTQTQAPLPLCTLSLVGTPALTLQQGQTDCTSQSQQHLSEQSISEEKKWKTEEKVMRKTAKRVRNRWRDRERGEEVEGGREMQTGKTVETLSFAWFGYPPPFPTSSSWSCCCCVFHPCWGPTCAPLPQPHIGSQ